MELIKKHTKLINYREQRSLNPLEQKLLIYCVGKAVQNNEVNVKTYINLKDIYIDNKKINGKKYKDIANALRGVYEASLSVQSENGAWKEQRILSEIGGKHTGNREEDALYFVVSANIKEYILDLKSSYTEVMFSQILEFKSSYSIRLYEILKQQIRFNKKYFITVDTFKEKLGLHKTKSYESYYALKSQVIQKAMTELNSKSDINVSLKEEKQGRKVWKLIFEAEEKQQADSSTLQTENQNQAQSQSPFPPVQEKAVTLTESEQTIYNAMPTDEARFAYLKGIGKEGYQTEGEQAIDITPAAPAVPQSDPINQTAIADSPEVQELKKKNDILGIRLKELGLDNGTIQKAQNRYYSENGNTEKFPIWKELNNLKMAIRDSQNFPNIHTFKKWIEDNS